MNKQLVEKTLGVLRKATKMLRGLEHLTGEEAERAGTVQPEEQKTQVRGISSVCVNT